MIYKTLLAIAWFLINIYWYYLLLKIRLIIPAPSARTRVHSARVDASRYNLGYTNQACVRLCRYRKARQAELRLFLQRIGISRFNTANFQNIAHGGAVIW